MGILFKKLNQRLAFNHLISGNYQKAERYFQRQLKSSPGAVGNRYNMGLVKLAQGEYAEAVEFFRDELERFGEEYHRLRSLADAYYLWEKAEEARHWYRQAKEMVSSDKERALITARLQICEEPELLGRAVEGARSFEQAVAAQKEGRIEEAIAACLRAVEADPTNFMARNNLGSIYLNEKNDLLRARAEFEAALEYSDLPLIHKNLQLCKAKESDV